MSHPGGDDVAGPEIREEFFLALQLSFSSREDGHRFAVTVPLKRDVYKRQGDSLRTNQIFINLLSNAIKFTPEGGSVDFLAQQIEPVENPLHVRYRFIVSDTGIGMTKEFLAHVFDPFCRSDNAARIEGTGLGLSLIHILCFHRKRFWLWKTICSIEIYCVKF